MRIPKKKSLRTRVIEGLERRRGPGCQCCGYMSWRGGKNLSKRLDGELARLLSDAERHMFLTVDHVNNDGHISRKTLGYKGEKFFKWIIDHDYPNTVQILCHSCNQAKRLNGGVCPHDE